MNYRGSYKKLLANAKAALVASIEIYNKPAFEYRDECVVILLLNAWELLLKAVLSKGHESIYYPKKRRLPYRTLSLHDTLAKVKNYLPTKIDNLPVQRNLELLSTYRDNAVHFYNERDFGTIIYSLAQTSIVNFRDLVESEFGERVEEQINWRLLPLGFDPPIDVVTFMSGRAAKEKKKSHAVEQFLAELAASAEEVRKLGQDRGRLLTVFSINLQSVKKIGDADLVVGVARDAGEAGPLAIVKTQDPNTTHPLRAKDVVPKIQDFLGDEFSSHTFQAIVWKHRIKDSLQYCWKAREGQLTLYSYEVITYVRRLTKSDIETALKDYRTFIRSRSKKSKRAEVK